VSTGYTLRDLRYVTRDGEVILRPDVARDVVDPDPERIAQVYGTA
jgi:hypothetical protein